MSSRPVRGRVAAALAAVAVASGGLGLAAPAAQAAALEGRVTLVAVSASDDGLSLTVTVTNTGTEPLYTAEVMLWRAATAATDRAGLDALLDAGEDIGGRLGYPHTDAYAVLATDDQAFAPGASTTATLTATWDELGLDDPGIYLAGAQLHAAAAAGDAGQVVASARTLVVRPGDVTAERIAFVALTSAPSVLVTGEFADDHLAEEFAPRQGTAAGGRLTELAYAAARPGYGWLIDPALYAAAVLMRDGYEVRSGDDETVAGTGQAAAAAWLALVDALPRNTGYRTLWHNPDLVLAGQTGDAATARSQQAFAAALAADDPAIAPLAGLPLVIAPAGGVFDAATLAAAQAAGDALLLGATPGGSGATALTTVLPAFPNGPSPEPAAPLQRRQRALAEDYLAALEDRPSVRVLTTVDEASLASAPLPAWISRRPADDLPIVWRRAADPGTATPVLTQANHDAVAEALGQLDVYTSLTGGADAETTVCVNDVLTAALSQDWADPVPALAFASDAKAYLAGRLGQVRVGLADIVLTSRDTSFPISIENGLDQTIRVHLDLASSSSLRLTASYRDAIEVEPGRLATVVVTPDIRSNGQITLTARLVTEAGQPVGEPATATVRINQTARLAWAIVVVSGIVLAIGTVLRVTTVQRSRRLEAGGPSPPGAADD